jgi:tRNA U38,U39,U40 pseudouridine synthase TruA
MQTAVSKFAPAEDVEKIEVYASGRTDAGVHAMAQVRLYILKIL